VIVCNEWKTEKGHEFTNVGKLKATRIMMATVRHVTSSSGLRKFQAAWFLLNRGYQCFVGICCLSLQGNIRLLLWWNVGTCVPECAGGEYGSAVTSDLLQADALAGGGAVMYVLTL